MTSLSGGTLNVLGKSEEEVVEAARAAGIALKASELVAIAEKLGRDPTVVEAHAFDAQWSEHCSYKSSRAFLSRLPTAGPGVLVGVGEDAGIVRLGEWEGETYGVVVAHESHNHPSQVVPFEGAATGVGGIVRDVLCMGAQVIAVADALRLGPQDDPHCRYVAQSVVDGIAAYGNAIGVPNIAGDVYFEEGFRDNCLVNVIALGLVKERDIIHSSAPAGSDGWDIVLVGKATDRSGFGGAAFSSLVLDEEDAQANKGAVQVPDPFLKNVIMRATYRAFDVIADEQVTVGFKDLGAGGIMGCTAELVASGGYGAVIDLDRCPTSQANLPAAVIAVGETQERLAWVVPPHFTSRLLAIYNEEFGLPDVAEGACAAIVGRVTAEKEYVLRSHGEVVMHVPIDFLTAGIRYERRYESPAVQKTPEQGDATASIGETLERVLSHRDVCSRAPIYERYDSVVRGTTSIPAGAADAGVIVPVPGAPLAVALGVGGNPRYGKIDPMRAGELAVVEAVRNVAAVGARPAALTDCLNFGNPEDPAQFGEFVAAVGGIGRAAKELGLPFVTGNVSLYNQSAAGSAIPASPIVACVGTMDDVSRAVTQAFKRAGSPVYLLSGGKHPFVSLGGSVIADVLHLRDAPLPHVDYAALRNELAALAAAFERGLVLAAHDVSDGGLVTALAEMAFPTLATAPIGVRLAQDRGFPAYAEMTGIVVETTDGPAFEAICAEHHITRATAVAVTTSDAALVERDGTSHDLRGLCEAWSAPLRTFYGEAS
jgi:phosphoribosylformylglycinamidine synthase